MRHLIWDDRKRDRNLRVHGFDFEDAYDFEWTQADISQTYPSKTGTLRFLATGRLGGRMVTIIFSVLGSEAYAIVSMRPASRKEREKYGSQ
jgi:uncharacterized DUF497 family protein